ncbi:MAG: cupin domain-containing protein [Conexibacteraceae bacterium]|nr:cupin domain-containing protein [Conexibacteraceae bacterium]
MRAYWGPGDTYTFLVTGEESGGAMFAMDCVLGPGGGPPPHRHLAEDELFHVYEGQVDFTVEGETHTITAGQSAFIARGTAHSYVNATEAPARMLTVYTPAGMEGWFLEVCTPVSDPSLPAPAVTPELIERMLEAGPRHNVEWLV